MQTKSLADKDKQGFHFTTDKGTCYYYDDRDGSVQVADPAKRSDTEDTSPEAAQMSSVEHVRTRGVTSTESEINTASVVRHLETSGFRQLILVVTQDCNLRCLYCAYSGNYENMRTHRARPMTPDVAEEALKRYFEGFRCAKRRDPYRMPTISFYGGEPMMNFGLIRHIVELARALYPGTTQY